MIDRKMTAAEDLETYDDMPAPSSPVWTDMYRPDLRVHLPDHVRRSLRERLAKIEEELAKAATEAEGDASGRRTWLAWFHANSAARRAIDSLELLLEWHDHDNADHGKNEERSTEPETGKTDGS